MTTIKRVILLISLLIEVAISNDYYAKSEQLKLFNELLTDYRPDVRPVLDDDTTTNLTIVFSWMKMLDIDHARETILLSAEFDLYWRDEFLRWNPEEHDNITIFTVKAFKIWKPDVTVYSAVKLDNLMTSADEFCTIRYDGLIQQSIYAVIQNMCDLEVQKFPYDSQKCCVELGLWTYTDNEVHVLPTPEHANSYGYFGNSEWDVTNVTNEAVVATDNDSVNFSYSSNKFHVYIKRRPQFYIWVMLIPTFVITAISICGAFMPTNSYGDREEKVTLGMTTMLSHVVILQIISNEMPKSSQLPLLGNFILAEIFIVAIAVIMATTILTLHHRAETRGWMPPKWVLWFLRVTCSKKFMRKTKSKMKIDESEISERKAMKCNDDSLKELYQLNAALQELIAFEEYDERDWSRQIAWTKFFDRIDAICLVVLEIGNALVTWLLCRH